MTNPTPHGQVPEALIDLIDAYAETRHRCGGVYNAKTEAARNAVIEALSGVQALSAAPAIGDELRDTLVAVSAAIAERDDRAAQKMICEILAASTTPPAEQQAPRCSYCDGTGDVHGIDGEWRGICTECDAGTALRQQAQPGAVYAELPQPDSWFHFTAQFWENKLRDFADRTHALRIQAAPKAAPVTQQAGYAEVIECGNSYAKVKLKGEAFGSTKVGDIFYTAPPVEQLATTTEGYVQPMPDKCDQNTWRGPYYHLPLSEQAAPKAAPGEQNTVPAEWLEQAYREGWAACRDAETIGEEAEDWAFGNSTANSRMIDAQQAAPKQEAQEPVGVVEHAQAQTSYIHWTAAPPPNGAKLYTAPQPTPAPAPLSDDAKDAARYRWLRDTSNADDPSHMIALHIREEQNDASLSGIDAAIDAALAAQGGKA